jgi:hypothetical protein
VGQDLYQAHDREIPKVGEKANVFRSESIAAQTEGLEVGNPLSQLGDEFGTVELARGFSARDQETGHS